MRYLHTKKKNQPDLSNRFVTIFLIFMMENLTLCTLGLGFRLNEFIFGLHVSVVLGSTQPRATSTRMDTKSWRAKRVEYSITKNHRFRYGTASYKSPIKSLNFFKNWFLIFFCKRWTLYSLRPPRGGGLAKSWQDFFKSVPSSTLSPFYSAMDQWRVRKKKLFLANSSFWSRP